jgi:hypothetical protein
MDDRSRYRVIKRFEKPRPAAPLAVAASDGIQRGLRAEDADDSREDVMTSRAPTGEKKKTSPKNSSRANAVLKIVVKAEN